MHKARLVRTLRFFSTNSCEECKPFEAIPSPKGWPVVGHLPLFSRFGPYSMDKIMDAFQDLNAKHGSIVRVDLGIRSILLFDPEDIKELYRTEGKYPRRPIFEILQHYRRSRPNLYSTSGLVTENGEPWWKLRHSINWMLRPEFSRHFLSGHESLTDDFIQHVRKIRDRNNEVHDFLMEIYKFTLEAAALLCLGNRFGAIEGKDKDGIFPAVHETLDCMMKTLLGLPIWKIFKTPTYKRLERAQDTLYRVIKNSIEAAKQRKKSENINSIFLNKLLNESQLDERDVTLTILEVLSAGTDTTGNTISFLLYHLSKNPDVQEKLHNEVKGKNDFSNMANFPYLKACLKETNRLTPSTGATARILSQDLILSGYKVPADVICFGVHPVIGRMTKYFSEPEKFIPERWLRDGGKLAEQIHPYALLPFGHGVRRCIGQRIAEQEIYLFIAKMLQNFVVQFPHGEISYVMRLQMLPDRPLTFRLTDRLR